MTDHTSVVCIEMKLSCHDRSTGYGLWWKLDKRMTWPNEKVCSTPKTILNCHDQSDQVSSVIKTKQDKRDWSNRFSLCQNQNSNIGNYLTRCHLWRKPNRITMWSIIQVHSTLKMYWIVMTDWIKSSFWWIQERTMTWTIVQVCSMLKMILNFHDQLDRVSIVTKTK